MGGGDWKIRTAQGGRVFFPTNLHMINKVDIMPVEKRCMHNCYCEL